VVALNSANAGKHWDKMTEQDAHIWHRFYWFYVEKDVREDWLDLGQEIENLVVKKAKGTKNGNCRYFLTNPIESWLNFVMFSGMSAWGNFLGM
jgi:hypothetical protein